MDKLKLAEEYAQIIKNTNKHKTLPKEYPLPPGVIPGSYWGFIKGFEAAQLHLNQKQFDTMARKIEQLQEENAALDMLLSRD